jgi:geranylgeranyl pyrophosphate synthase
MIEFEKFLQNNLIKNPSFHPYFEKATNEMLLAGGKRFRPMLLLKVVEAYNPLLIEGAYYPALALECLHTYSLIHDDLPAMDNANLRRGHPTLHKTYDEVTAILVGDGLNTYAFELISISPLHNDIKVALTKELAQNSGLNGMVLGQAIDCYFENKPLNLDEVKFLHIHKTAKLIAASLKMGAIIVNLEKNLQEKLYNFGIDLGLLFQIQDDILDETKSSKEAGKDTHNDGDKNSFVNLMGLEKSIKEADKLADKLKKEFESFDEKLRHNLKPLITKYLKRHKQ